MNNLGSITSIGLLTIFFSTPLAEGQPVQGRVRLEYQDGSAGVDDVEGTRLSAGGVAVSLYSGAQQDLAALSALKTNLPCRVSALASHFSPAREALRL